MSVFFDEEQTAQIEKLDLCLCIESLYYHPDPQSLLEFLRFWVQVDMLGYG